MTPEERKVYENIRSPHLKYWIPVVWFSNLASKARQEGRIQDSIDLQNILNVTHEISLTILHSVSKCERIDIYREGKSSALKQQHKIRNEITLR